MANDKIFADGFNFNRNDNAPDFVAGQLNINAEKAIAFIREHQKENGYIDLKVLKSRKGGYYVELDTWVPKAQTEEF